MHISGIVSRAFVCIRVGSRSMTALPTLPEPAGVKMRHIDIGG